MRVSVRMVVVIVVTVTVVLAAASLALCSAHCCMTVLGPLLESRLGVEHSGSRLRIIAVVLFLFLSIRDRARLEN